MSLGAQQAGLRVVAAVEKDVHAANTYQKNHPDCDVFHGDIRDLSDDEVRRMPRGSEETVVFGGPPCQGFSYSNSRTRSRDNADNWLFTEFIRFVRVLRPEFVIFENVRGIVDTAGGVFLGQVLGQLADAGYNLSHGLLNAKDHGVPQDRARFFLIGARNGSNIPLPTRQSERTLTVRDAISDLPKLENGASTSWLRYRDKATSPYAQELRGDSVGCPNHLVTRNATHILRRYAHIPPGGNWESIPPALMENYRDRSRCHTGIYRRLRYDHPASVIANFRKNMLVHPIHDRGLSVREAARIQSFPDSYEFCGSIGFQQQQVGNAVPPLLAKAVFEVLPR